jgi:hypothetical protein
LSLGRSAKAGPPHKSIHLPPRHAIEREAAVARRGIPYQCPIVGRDRSVTRGLWRLCAATRPRHGEPSSRCVVARRAPACSAKLKGRGLHTEGGLKNETRQLSRVSPHYPARRDLATTDCTLLPSQKPKSPAKRASALALAPIGRDAFAYTHKHARAWAPTWFVHVALL